MLTAPVYSIHSTFAKSVISSAETKYSTYAMPLSESEAEMLNAFASLKNRPNEIAVAFDYSQTIRLSFNSTGKVYIDEVYAA